MQGMDDAAVRTLPTRVPLRIARAGVFALAGTGLGVAAHRLGGDALPPGWLVSVAAVALFGVAFAFTGAQRRLPVVAGLVLTTQTAMHVAFALVGMPGMTTTTGRGGSLLSMVLCHPADHAPSTAQLAAARSTLRSLHVTPTAPVVSHTGGAVTTGMTLMFGAHLLAAAVMAWWLARGERAVWRRARRVAATIRTVLAGPPRPVVAPNRPIRHTAAASSARWSVLRAAGRAPPHPAFLSLLPAAA